jgi:hypothetical protein
MFRDAVINIDFATQGVDISNITNAAYMFYRADINTPFVNVDISSATNANGLF